MSIGDAIFALCNSPTQFFSQFIHKSTFDFSFKKYFRFYLLHGRIVYIGSFVLHRTNRVCLLNKTFLWLCAAADLSYMEKKALRLHGNEVCKKPQALSRTKALPEHKYNIPFLVGRSTYRA